LLMRRYALGAVRPRSQGGDDTGARVGRVGGRRGCGVGWVRTRWARRGAGLRGVSGHLGDVVWRSLRAVGGRAGRSFVGWRGGAN